MNLPTALKLRQSAFACSIGLLLLAGAHAAEPGKEQPLFDGRSFDGWEGDKGIFRIENGAIVAGNPEKGLPHNEFLCTTREFGDFELKLHFKLSGKKANAGVQFRSRRIPNHHEVIGYQADLGDGWWGSLYDESRRKTMLAKADMKKLAEVLKPDDWNEYVIRCQGPHIQLWINGLKTVDYTEPDAKIEQRGIIGLQIHGGPPSQVWYKQIELKEL